MRSKVQLSKTKLDVDGCPEPISQMITLTTKARSASIALVEAEYMIEEPGFEVRVCSARRIGG